jgi:hypothetical protein
MSNWEFVHWKAFRKMSPSLVDRLNWGLANVAQTVALFSLNKPKEAPKLTDFLLEFDPEVLKKRAEERKEKASSGAQSLEQMMGSAARITRLVGGKVLIDIEDVAA